MSDALNRAERCRALAEEYRNVAAMCDPSTEMGRRAGPQIRNVPLFWMKYRHPDGRFAGAVVIKASALISARMAATVFGLDDGLEFVSGCEIEATNAERIPAIMIDRLLSEDDLRRLLLTKKTPAPSASHTTTARRTDRQKGRQLMAAQVGEKRPREGALALCAQNLCQTIGAPHRTNVGNPTQASGVEAPRVSTGPARPRRLGPQRPHLGAGVTTQFKAAVLCADAYGQSAETGSSPGVDVASLGGMSDERFV
jgi:hypothetical protein